jgi:hypothetical protein
MNRTNDTAVVAGRASGQTTRPHRLRRLVGTGGIATLGATAATTLAATPAQAVGVDFEVSNDGRPIPLAGFAVVTGFFSVVGIVIAANPFRQLAVRLAMGCRLVPQRSCLRDNPTLASCRAQPVVFALRTGTV